MTSNPVQGFVYESVDDNDAQNGNICRIVRRGALSDAETREMGPAFVVQFGNGEVRTVSADELHPWYPTG